VYGRLTDRPADILVVNGQMMVQLNCTSDIQLPVLVDWHFKPAGSHTRWDNIVHIRYLIDKYTESKKIEFLPTIDGVQNLIIRNVTFSDAGTYRCWDDGGLGTAEYALAELVVVETRMKCTHNISDDFAIGGDICGLGLRADVVNCTCSIIYKGTVAPTFRWKYDGRAKYKNVTRDTHSDTLSVSSLILEINEKMNNTRFSCLIELVNSTVSGSSPYQNISWNSPLINLAYITFSNSTIETICEPITTDCSISSNLKCDYNWLTNRNEITVSTAVLPEPDIKYIGYGWYNCSVQCPIRGQHCRFTERILEYNDCETRQNMSLTPTITERPYYKE